MSVINKRKYIKLISTFDRDYIESMSRIVKKRKEHIQVERKDQKKIVKLY